MDPHKKALNELIKVRAVELINRALTEAKASFPDCSGMVFEVPAIMLAVLAVRITELESRIEQLETEG